MIDQLDIWLGNINNFNLFVGIQMVIALVSVAVVLFYTHKIGKADERTIHIQYKIFRAMFYTLFTAIMLVYTQVSAEMHFIRQYISMAMTLSIAAGAIASAYYYHRDRD